MNQYFDGMREFDMKLVFDYQQKIIENLKNCMNCKHQDWGEEGIECYLPYDRKNIGNC